MDKDFWDAMDKMHQHQMDIMNYNNAIISEFGNSAHKYFKSLVGHCTITGKITFATNPMGEKQNEKHGIFTNIHVDQWSVGDTGDSFAGFIYAKVNDKWICVPFDC